MKTTTLLGAMLTAFAICAAADDMPMGGKPSAGKPGQGGGMSMMDMAGKSKGACMATSDTLGGLLKTVQEAKKSNDKAKMKAALERVETHIAGMKTHMGQCMDMMGMMGKMMEGGMMGGGMMGADSPQGKQPDSVPKTAPKPGLKSAPQKFDSAEHKKHHPQ